MAVCMANGGGGNIVFGVADKVQGRQNAIRGVPNDLDLYMLQNRVYTKTDPHLLPTLQYISCTRGNRSPSCSKCYWGNGALHYY